MKRSDRIKKHVPITQFLYDYGYLQSPDDREQQFRCDLHGDTRDRKPSARVYADEGHAYCFACNKSRDVIGWTMEREGLEFNAACTFLERKYELPVWVYAPKEAEAVTEEEVVPEFARVEKLIRAYIGDLGVQVSAKFFEAVDALSWQYTHGQKGRDCQVKLDSIRQSLLAKLKDAA